MTRERFDTLCSVKKNLEELSLVLYKEMLEEKKSYKAIDRIQGEETPKTVKMKRATGKMYTSINNVKKATKYVEQAINFYLPDEKQNNS